MTWGIDMIHIGMIHKAFKFSAPALLALAVLASPAMARDHHDGHGGTARHQADNRQGNDRQGNDRQGNDRHGYRQPRVAYRNVPAPQYRNRTEYRSAPRYRTVYRARPVYRAQVPRWSVGSRYYDDGYGPSYVVADYGYYGLRQPPRGYGWRRDDRGDFILVAIATGIIADLLLHGGYGY